MTSGFPQTQIQNDRWLLHFQISPTKCGRKTFDVFSEWLTPFSNFPGVVWTGHECLQFQGSPSKLMLMYLSMLSLCGGRPGIGGAFDITSLPVVGTFDRSPSPGGRNFWLQLLVDWALPTPSWMTENDWKQTEQNWKETMFQIAGCAWDAQKFGLELNIVADIL